jgi:hypothetical protein
MYQGELYITFTPKSEVSCQSPHSGPCHLANWVIRCSERYLSFLDDLLPWADKLPEECRKKIRIQPTGLRI